MTRLTSILILFLAGCSSGDLDVPEPLAGDEKLKIAVMETAFDRKAGDVTSFADAKAAGYSAIQMHSGQPEGMNKNNPIDPATSLEIGKDPSVLKSWKQASEELGVKIVSLCAGSLNACQIWGRDYEVSMRIAKQTIDACEYLEAPIMLFPFFGNSRFQDSDVAYDGVLGFLKDLLPYAVEKDVIIGIEAPVTTDRVVSLIKKLGSPPHLKVYYDTGNLYPMEDIYENIRKYGRGYFCEVHIKSPGSLVVGEGDVDLAKVAAALDAVAYDKWLVYEAGRGGRDPVANLESLKKIVSLREQ